ncbi:MAG: SprB repeat-containing protein, partial [Flavobacteriales bacterium]
CNPADINWATQGYFVSPNPNAGETLADGVTGVYYSDNIYLQVPTNIQQVIPTAPNVNISSLTFNNILVTPSGSTTAVALSTIGLSYQCNSNGTVGSCVFLPNQPSCIEIFGVPNTTGLFTLTFSVNVSAGFINLPYQLQIMTITIGGVGCTDINACNYNPNATIDNQSCTLPGDPCNDGLIYSVNDSINADCICAGVCAVITPIAEYEPINCNGGSTQVNFTYNGGNIPESVVINGLDTIHTNVLTRLAGSFSYYLITEGGCVSSTYTMTIDQPSPLSVQLSAENVQCRGYATGSVTAVASGGILPYSYSWSNGLNTMIITDLVSGVYMLEITDNNGCMVEDSVEILEPTSSLSINAFTNNPTCGNNNGSINIQTSNAVGDVSFSWNDVNGSNQLDSIGAGVYSLTVQDDFCEIDTTIILNPSNGPEISSFELQNISCYGDSNGYINLAITGGTAPVTVQWSDGGTETNRSNLSAGDYVVTLTDALNCSYTQAFELTQPEEIVAQISTQDVECFGDNSGSVSFEITSGAQPYSISWNDGIVTSQSLYPNLLAGEYNYYIEDSLGCTLNGMVTINGPSAPIEVVIEGDPIVCGDLLGSATAVVTGADLVTYQWSNDAITPTITDIPVGEYSVIATSGSCSDTAYF